MQRWSASSSANDSDSSEDTQRQHQDERLKRRQRVKRRNTARNAASDSSDYSTTTSRALAAAEIDENEKANNVVEKDFNSRWSPLKNALRSLTLTNPRGTKPKSESKKILRSPVAHVYVKGPSGLPTQRVPLGAANFTDFCCVQRSVALRALLLEP
ncbi:uncharacterized protein LOC132197903 [Neocloeon triangulifer]|uniref:uncharacterized protein LOC132197903 n=1 Tax=Neocloeon triangulifer TaxID=2078957 RepID=UPI00286F3142|nr:uncharacterized protein LOC132197903 [Neocloeon triangulifer]